MLSGRASDSGARGRGSKPTSAMADQIPIAGHSVVLSLLEGEMSRIWYQNDQKYPISLNQSTAIFYISCSHGNLSWNITWVGAFSPGRCLHCRKRASSAHVRWILQVPCKSIPVSRFTGKWVDYSFVLLESTRSIFYSPYSVNVTLTNELLEVCKTLNSAKTLCFMTFFLILYLLPIQKGGMLYVF